MPNETPPRPDPAERVVEGAARASYEVIRDAAEQLAAKDEIIARQAARIADLEAQLLAARGDNPTP